MAKTGQTNKLDAHATEALGADLYGAMPKSVMAMIMLSFAQRLTEDGDTTKALALIADEWRVLHAQAIVPQAPYNPAKQAQARGGRAQRSADQRLYWARQVRDGGFAPEKVDAFVRQYRMTPQEVLVKAGES